MPPGRAGHAGSHGETPGSVRRQRGTHGKKLYSGFYGASLVVQTVENMPTMQETQLLSLGQEDTLEKGRVSRLRISWFE